MLVNQASKLLVQIVGEQMGTDVVKNNDLTGCVSVGKYLHKQAPECMDLITGKLIDRIGHTVIDAKSYNPAFKSIVVDAMTFGAVRQSIYIEPMDPEDSPEWTIKNGDSVYDAKVKLPDVRVRYDSNLNTWHYELSIPHFQMFSSMNSEETWAAFVDGIYISLETSMKQAIEAMTNAAVCELIGENLDYAETNPDEGIHAINVLKLYNDTTGKTLTAANCRQDANFHKFVGRVLHTNLHKMSDIGVIYNTEGYKRFTTPEEARILMLQEYADDYSTFLQADTFHNELVALPGYTNVNFWQGQGKKSTFEDCSTVDIVLAKNGKTVKQTGIIAVVFDPDAVVCMFDNLRTSSELVQRKEITQIYSSADKGYIVNTSNNSLVLYIADTSIPAVAKTTAKK